MPYIKPIMRWAGGKVWLTNTIENYLPVSFNNYHEPFVGGCSIFLHLMQAGVIKKNVYLSDSNEELINAYIVIRDEPDELISLLRNFKNEKEFYYKTRASIPDNNIERAARFIFLNRTSFNGIYRENLKGIYNVPFGFRKLSQLFDFKNISEVSRLLANVSFSCQDFEGNLNNIKENDLIFIDPPYTVAHENNGFVKYNRKIFSWEDQERLKAFIDKIIVKNAYFILTNAAHASIEQLYEGIGNNQRLSRSSTIGGKGAQRDKFNELIYYNTLIDEKGK